MIIMKFAGLPELNWDEILSRSIVESQCDDIPHNPIRRLFSCFFMSNIRYEYVNSSTSKILCFQSYYSRQSYLDQMDNFAKLCNANLIRGKKDNKHKPISVCFFIKNLLPWYISLLKYNCPHWVKFMLLKDLISIYELSIFFSNKNLNYNLLVTFCDSILEEAYVTVLFKEKNIKTATLQHGQFTSFRENKIINSGIELRTLKSDYFLVWNKMTVDECTKQNVRNTTSIICGILGYIGKKYAFSTNPHNHIFGVVINHEFFEAENISLIKSANRLAKVTGYKYYLKLHPNYAEDYFDNYVEKDYYKGNIKK